MTGIKFGSDSFESGLFPRLFNMNLVRDHEVPLGKIRTLFWGKGHKDTVYSWVVCILSAVCNAVNLGFALSFGVLFPELIDYFEETRERAG